MKKLCMVLLALMMVLSATGALAGTWTHEGSGIVVDLPEGATAEDVSTENLVGLHIVADVEGSPDFYVYVEYDEGYAETWLEDLDEEELQALAAYYAREGTNAAFKIIPGETISLMVMVTEDSTDVYAICLLNGWLISVEAVAPEGVVFDEGILEDIQFLLGCIHLPAEE